ncbi:oxidoreductase-like domain-containing protein [Caballeronia sp. LZ043]|nr:oxidoreductase-like domain-containing protein [Caballeronia sp. LZ043]MDR5824838.1 oxidoreductase-like domain-containing protein [Caballeronia sp. LZ043]
MPPLTIHPEDDRFRRSPLPGDCCQSGCDPCVFDLYDEALARYRTELAAWEARHRPQAARDD